MEQFWFKMGDLGIDRTVKFARLFNRLTRLTPLAFRSVFSANGLSSWNTSNYK